MVQIMLKITYFISCLKYSIVLICDPLFDNFIARGLYTRGKPLLWAQFLGLGFCCTSNKLHWKFGDDSIMSHFLNSPMLRDFYMMCSLTVRGSRIVRLFVISSGFCQATYLPSLTAWVWVRWTWYIILKHSLIFIILEWWGSWTLNRDKSGDISMQW